MSRRPPAGPQLPDELAELVRREVDRKLRDLQQAADLRLLGSFSLADGVPTTITHKLGRAPKQLIVSPPRSSSTTGHVREVRTGNRDRTQVIVLEATGFGATVSVDVAVV